MLEKIKLSLRVKNTAFDTEITELIAACKVDLGLAGIIKLDDTDALISRAITLYCKANFGLENTDSEKYQKSYDMLKISLAVAGDYNV